MSIGCNKLKKIDTFLSKKNKVYFLLRRLGDYEKKLDNHTKWSVQVIKMYEKKYQRMCRKYKKINIYGIEFMGIGETVSRLFMYLHDKDKRDKNILHIVLPTFSVGYHIGGIVNKKLFVLFQENIHFILGKNIDFWKYVTIVHSHRINIEFFDTYKYRDSSVEFKVELGKPLLPFSDQVTCYAKKKKQQMGLGDKYICIHAREVATKVNNFISSYEDTSAIDSNINSYDLACQYMRDLGYQSVRMGKDESKSCEIAGVIDYANEFYDELMDFYLLANCKFLVGCSSGITAIAAFWGRPILHTNALSFCYGQEALPRTEYDLYIPKKFYSMREKRLLNLYETWDISFKCDRFTKRFDEAGIILIDNTETEILNAVKEMNAKLDHSWIYTKEEMKCIGQYWQIINLWREKHKLTYMSKKNGGQGRDMFPRPICYSYLKENLYLLDVKELYGET